MSSPAAAAVPASTTTQTLRARRRKELPREHPQRTQSTNTAQRTQSTNKAQAPPPPQTPDRSSAAASAKIWSEVNTQWSSLQSIASSVLSSSPTPSAKTPSKRQSWFAELIAPPGPPPSTSRPDPHSRARRRPPISVETSGAPQSQSYKTTPPPSPTSQKQEDTLVYIHPVTASTTLEGVVIAFDTTAQAVRRANGMWPGDAVQGRRELCVPVHECQVRGTPVKEDPDVPEDSRAWTPHSIVMLPGVGKTVIARLPARRGRRRRTVVKDPVVEEEEMLASTPTHPFLANPGVHTFHPETESTLEMPAVDWGEMVKGAGKVEGWLGSWGRG